MARLYGNSYLYWLYFDIESSVLGLQQHVDASVLSLREHVDASVLGCE